MDTYVYPFWLVYGEVFHVPSLSYPGDNGAPGLLVVGDPEGGDGQASRLNQRQG